MAQPPEGFKGIALGDVEEAVERRFAKVIFPAGRGGDFVGALRVGESAETAALEFLGERTELDFEVLRKGV